MSSRSEEGKFKRKLKKKAYGKERSKKVKQELKCAKEVNEEVTREKEKIQQELTSVKEESNQIALENANLNKLNEKMKSDLKSSHIELETLKKQVSHQSNYLSTYSKSRVLEKRGCAKLKQAELSDQVVKLSEDLVGKGTFGVVKIGRMTQLGIQCAIKSGNSAKYFDAHHEASYLFQLQGSNFFPHLFGVFNHQLVMEYVLFNTHPMTILKARNDDILDQKHWTMVCFQLIKALVFIHRQSILHNDLKVNNVLLRSTLTPVIIDFGKATKRNDPEIYRLTDAQRIRYNIKYQYLAHELRNIPGSRTSTATDIYSLGHIYQFVADKENSLLQELQQKMQEKLSKRITSPEILRFFNHWENTKKD